MYDCKVNGWDVFLILEFMLALVPQTGLTALPVMMSLTLSLSLSLSLSLCLSLSWFIYVICNYIRLMHGIRYDFHPIWCCCRISATRRVPLVEQELLTLPAYPSSPRFLVEFLFLHLYWVFCRSLVILSFSLFWTLHFLSSSSHRFFS